MEMDMEESHGKLVLDLARLRSPAFGEDTH